MTFPTLTPPVTSVPPEGSDGDFMNQSHWRQLRVQSTVIALTQLASFVVSNRGDI